MSSAVAITRTELTAAELRAAAARSRDAKAARRMLAVALVLEGVDRKTAAETCGMDRQTLRDWVHRYNAEGLAGLTNHRGGSRPRRLDPGQVAESRTRGSGALLIISLTATSLVTLGKCMSRARYTDPIPPTPITS